MHVDCDRDLAMRAGDSLLSLCVLTMGLSACQGPTGRVQLFVEAEFTIPKGLKPGPGDHDIQDGWTVRYDKFLVGFGDFHARSTSTELTLEDPSSLVFDLRTLPNGGYLLRDFADVPAVRWEKVGFSILRANLPETQKANGTRTEDFAAMQSQGRALYVEAVLTKPDGVACMPGAPTDCVPRTEHRVRWGLDIATSFADCAPEEGQAGFAVPSGGTVQIAPTIHGDHWFFTNLTSGVEITERRAQWIVDCDLDRDGETTLDELRAVPAGDVFDSGVYNLTGGLKPINTAFDYLEAQARTLGDYQGHGECPTRQAL